MFQKLQASQITVAVRLRPLFQTEQKAAQWKHAIVKPSEKDLKQAKKGMEPKEFHSLKLMDQVQSSVNNGNQNQSDPFSKMTLGS